MISWIDTERGRLIQKMKAAKGKGGKTQKPMWRQKEMFHCDDLTVDINTLND